MQLSVGNKLVSKWRDAIARSDCMSQATQLGHDPESAQRICDAISDDVPNTMEKAYPDKTDDQKQKKKVIGPGAPDTKGTGKGKSAWLDPTQGLSEVEPSSDDEDEDEDEGDGEDDFDQDTQDDYKESLGYDKSDSHDLGNDGPDFDSVASLDGNDHIDTHMSDSQKGMYNDHLDGSNDVSADAEKVESNSDLPELPDQSDPAQQMKVKTVMPDFRGPIIAGQSTADEQDKEEQDEPEEDDNPEEEDEEKGKGNGNGKNNNNKKKSSNRVKSAQVEPFESNGHFFIKAFLLDTSLNQNNWGVSAKTLDANINSYVGKPLVLTEQFDHPDSGDPDLNHALLYQELYRIGTIVDVVKAGTRYDAICEITDPYSIDAWRQGEIPLYVSPQLYKEDAHESDNGISKWQGTHLALVQEPAFGVKVATFGGSCTGEADKCLAQLKKASIIEKHGYGSCGYCNRKLLLSARAIVHSNSVDRSSGNVKVNYPPGYEPPSSNDTSHDTQSQKSTRNKVPEPVKNAVAESESAQLQKKIASLEQKLAVALQSNKEKDTVNSDLAQRMAALEGEHRRDKVAAILSAAQIKEGFDERVNSLAKSNLPLEEISVIYKPYLEANSNSNSNSGQVKQASTTNNTNEQPKEKVQYVESKVTMKSAASEAPSNQKPAWLAARDYLMEGVA